MIITGPNASGKTTTLKSALINIILSQQIGYGCFESLKMCPYDTIHCYLNIPDTSGRDSLFQAEARRCKEIIDIIHLEKDKTHYCIFDELCADVTYWKTSSINSTLNSDLISAGITLRTKSYMVVFLGNSFLSCNNEKTAIPLEIIEIIFSLLFSVIIITKNPV